MATLNITVNSSQAKSGIDDLTQHALSQAARIKSAFSGMFDDSFSKQAIRDLQNAINSLSSNVDKLNSALGTSASKIRETSSAINDSKKPIKDLKDEDDRTSSSMLLNTLKVTASYMAMRAAIRGVVSAVEEGLEFENTMKLTALAIGATKDETISLEKEVRRLASTSIFAASEVTEAIKALALAGLSASEALTALPSVLNLAFIGEIDLEKAAASATNTMNAMKLTVSDLERIVDVFSATSIKTTASVQSLTEAMKYAAPIAGTLGYSIEEVTAMLGILAQAGINGGQAGRVLQQAFVKAEIAAKDFGMEGASLIEVLDEVNKRQLSTVEINKMFGLVALKGVLVLKENIAAYNEMTIALENTEGATANLVNSMETTTLSALKKLKSAITEVFLSLYDVFKGDLSSAFQTAANFLLSNKDNIVEFANILKATFQLIADSFTVISKLLSPIIQAFSETVAIAKELLKIIIGIGQVLMTPVRWFTGEDIPKESDFRWWKVLDEDIKTATEEVRQHEEALKSVKAEYADLSKTTVESINDIIMGWEGLSNTSLNDIFNWGGLLDLPSMNDIFGVAVAEAGGLEEKYVNIYNIKKLLLSNGISEATVIAEVNSLIGDQIPLIDRIKSVTPEIVKDFLEWKGIWSEISVLGFKFDTSLGRKSISEFAEFATNAISKEIEEIKSHATTIETELDSMFESVTDKQMVELAKQTEGYRKAADELGTETQRGQELTLKYVYNFMYEKKKIYAEDAKNQIDALRSVMDGLGEALGSGGGAISSSMSAVAAEALDNVIQTMKEKYSKILDLEQFQDEAILNNHEAALAIRLAKEKSFGDALAAQAVANMNKYAAAQVINNTDDWFHQHQESLTAAQKGYKQFEDGLTSLTITGSAKRVEIIKKQYSKYIDDAKTAGKDITIVEKAMAEALDNESKKVDNVRYKQASAYSKAEESARKYSEVIAEINSKIAAFEGDTYSSKMAKIEEQYLKYQKTLKGSSEELEKWRQLAEKEVNDKAAETIAQINREISEFKGEEADGYANAIDNINKKYKVFAANVAEGTAELQTWKSLAIESANLASAGFGDYKTGTYSKWPRSEDDIQKEAETVSNTVRNMYKDLGESSSAYYATEYALLDKQKEKYESIVKDNNLVDQWYYNEKRKILDKEILATDNFFEGMKVGYRKLLEDQMTWAKAGKKVVEDFAKNGTNAMSDLFFDVITGELENLEDIWKSFWQSMLKTMTDILAQMAMNSVLKMLFGASISGGLSINLGSTGGTTSAVESASGALSLASLVKSLKDLPETLANLPTSIVEGITALGETLGLVSVPASAAAATHTATSTAGAAVAMEKLATSVATATTSTTGMAVAAETSVASFEALDSALMSSASATSANMVGAATGAGIAGIIYFGANVLPGLIGGGKEVIDVFAEMSKFEQGYTNITKDIYDQYKTFSLGIQDMVGNMMKTVEGESGANQTYNWGKIDEWIAANQEFLNSLKVNDILKLLDQQNSILEKANEDNTFFSGNSYAIEDAVIKATIEVAVELATDQSLTLSEKMYQMGFIANESAGGWSSDAVMSMIAEFKNQGVAWEDINNAMIAYGATDADVYKRIYAEYHGDSILTDLESLTAALTAEGISEDVLKTIKYIYSSNIPLDQMQSLLEWAGLSSEEAARIVGQIDPSDEWKDLVIPVDAPDSIPVDYSSLGGRASGGPVQAGVPVIVGEIGSELFIPQENGHILSHDNMKKLMKLGIVGYADGTTDPLPGTPDWWAANPPSDRDINGDTSSDSTDTSAYDSISDWLDDYNEKLKEWLGTGNDLSDQIDDLNKFYEEQTGYANELQASQEQLDQLTKDQQAAKEKILQDWLNDEIAYYNEAMGLNTELGDSLAAISEHYKTAIEEATSAGATTEQLGEIQKAQTEVIAKALQDWLAGEVDYYNGMMGLNTELGNTLDGISEHYKNTIAEAQAAGATEEQLAEIRKASSEVTTKALQDWLDGETEYYNEMMGNTSALGNTLDEINKHYANTIAEATAAGATESQLAEIRKAQSAISQKAIQDEYDAFVEYYNGMMGIGSELGNQIDEVKQKFEEYKKTLQSIDPNADLSGLNTALQNIIDTLSADYWADYQDKVNEFSGISNDWMNEIEDINDFFKKAYNAAAGNATLQKQIMSDWEGAINYSLQSMITSYQSQVNKWLGISQTQEEAMEAEIYNYFYMIYAFAAALQADQTTLDKIIADYQAVSQRNKDTNGQMGSTGSTGSTGTTTDNGFSSALSEFTSELESYVDELRSLVEEIASTIDDIKYSSLNPYLTSSSKLAMAQGDYQKLFAAAKGGSTEDVQKYLAFVQTYLESAQSRYKSSGMYQQIYNQVMKDLGIIQTGTQTKLTKSEELLDKLNSNAISSLSALNSIKTILWNIQHGNTQSAYGASAIDSYGSVAGITSARNDNSSEDNKKIVNLLEGILMSQNKPQRVEIRLDSGRTLTGEMKSVADGVYVERSSRQNMAQRRIYQ